jgi:hypothetical protein
METPPPTYPTEQAFLVSQDSVWNAVIKVMSVFPLTVIERQSGILNTDWTTRTSYKHCKVWRGLAFGGEVEDDWPLEIRERFNVLVSTSADSSVHVRVIRYVQSRGYQQGYGGKGAFDPPTGPFVDAKSNTVPEHRILIAIDRCIRLGNCNIPSLDYHDEEAP